ncbi:MAG: GGDEF domain-containing protein [Candidatus Schekmanbacteria bacterium]|nr:GGDEF domain-containing protein [Candidatus Schekmanbacteria bacterium]
MSPAGKTNNIQLRSLLLILIFFTFVSLLIHDSKDIGMFWHLYIIPLYIAAVSYGLAGGLIVGILSTCSVVGWLYALQMFTPQQAEKLWEIGIGMALFIGTGITLGHSSGKQKAQKDMLEGLSIRDRLTGLFNYGYFLDHLEKERKRAQRYQNPLSVIMIDVDFFKRFNDTFGHEKGNEVLKRVAKVLVENTRNVDTVARYGGEEFVVTLPNATAEQAQTVAERIREAVACETFEGNDQQPIVNVTISGGIAGYPTQAEQIDKLIYKADQALYSSKENGRNQIRIFSE